MAEEDFELPVDPPETALEVEGVEPEIDEEDDELVTDPSGEPEALADGQPAQAAPQQSKANERVRRALAEAKEAKQQRDAVQREMMELLRGQVSRQQAPAPVDPAIERQKLDLMTEEERIEYRLNKAMAPLQAQLAQLSLQNEVSSDRAQFSSLVSTRPEFKRFESKVEERFQQLLQAGKAQSRESILKYLIGETVFAKGGKALSAARATGQENISRATTRPASGRSNVSGSEGSSQNEFAAAEARLKRLHDQGGFL